MFEPLPRLLAGLAIGFVFGFLLQKGRVAKFSVIVRQFTLEDWTVAKIMGTAIVVGAVGIYLLLPAGLVSLHLKPLVLGGILLGGLCFGIGIVVFGYCPGTGVAACGEGRRDAMVGVVGGLTGAGAYVLFEPHLRPLESWGDFGEVTFPSVTGASPWLFIAALAVLGLGALSLGARRRSRPPIPASRARGGAAPWSRRRAGL